MFNENYDFEYDDYGFEEEDLLTNFSERALPLYERAIKEYGDDSLYINTEAFDSRGSKIDGYYSLRTSIHKDRHSFWRLFDKIYAEGAYEL